MGKEVSSWSLRAQKGIILRSTSESGPVGASRSPSHLQNHVLSVFGVYSVSWGRLERPRGLEGRYRLADVIGRERHFGAQT